MFTFREVLAIVGLGSALTLVPGPAAVLGQDVISPPGERVLERGPHHNLVEVISELRDASGRVRAVTNRYTQLETGLNYRDAQGAWQPSTARIDLVGGQATFHQGQFKAVFAANIADPVAVELWTPDDQVLKSRILGLAWYDPESGQSVLLAELKDSTGELLPTGDALLYPDCLTDLLGDVRLTVTKAGLEQDLILREQPPGPEVFGLGPRSELQLLTEFFDPPVPREHVGERAVAEGTNLVASLTAPRVDPRLTFGAMAFGKGRAFRLDDTADAVPVQKTWERLEGRQFLIESVPYGTLRPQLDSLPKPVGVRSAQAAPSLRDHLRTTARKRAVAANSPSEIRVAQVSPARPGVVLDYFATLSSASNFTLKSDTTYYVTGPVILTGVTTIEGGTVVKFANSNNPHLKLQGAVRCQTGPCRPAFFTARDDNTVGAVISGSTGVPSGTYATTALWLDDNVASLQHLRIAWAGQAVYYEADTGWPQELWHVQISHCDYGVVALCPEFRVYNALMHQVGVNFHTASTNGPVTGRIEHLTSDTATWLNGGGTSLDLRLTNAVLVAVANPGPYSGAGNATGQATDFETVVAGGHYLAPTSAHRDAGTADIDSRLAAALAGLTTESPAVWTSTITEDTVLEPWVERDSDTPDRGYHYPALDFLLSAVAVNNATLTLTNGVAVGVYGTEGLRLQAGARFYSTGDPVNLNRLVHYRVAQEDTATANGRVADSLLRDDTAGSSSEARLRFTESVLPGGEGQHFNGGASLGWLALTDCQLLGGSFNFCYGGSYARIAGLTNNVFERVRTSLGYYGDAALVIHGRNNLFWNCPVLDLTPATAQTGWEWRENCFVGCTVYQYGSVQNSNNGYLGTATLNGSSGGDQTLTASPFVSGALGPWYLDPASALINAGNRTAGAAGLFHHTTRVDQAKDTGQVDIGFHYVAVTPAGQEIPLTGTDLDASSEYYNGQWDAPNAKNGLTSDPGWHNSGYTAVNEFLRVDLTTPRAVGRVAYVPRVMSEGDSDGSWNGVFRRYEVYVTDVWNSDPATWGPAVATGEWYWPNRQERKEVSFPERTGRYVYFLRKSAWGWYVTSNPGYACANEVWVHSPATPNPEAVDTDFDGLADYLEDADGNGLLSSTETDPVNPVSDPVSGLLDGIKRSPPPEVFTYSYWLTAHRDYHTSPRNGNTPDASVYMWWWQNRPGWRNSTGNYGELYEQPLLPETLLSAGNEDRWQSRWHGIRFPWEIRQEGGGKTYLTPLLLDWPQVPKEVCDGFVLERTTPALTYTRGAYTTSHLRTDFAHWPKKTRSVVVSCTASDLSDGATLDPTADGYDLGEPRNAQGGEEVSSTNITVAGKSLYPENAAAMIIITKGSSPPVVTPVVEDTIWYAYTLAIVPGLPHQVALAWSKHPSVTQPRDLQADFDAGANLLAEDDDGEGGAQAVDDVPCYMEFFLIKAMRATFPNNWDGTDFTSPEYNDVDNLADLHYLCSQTFANIKLVASIKLGGEDVPGSGAVGEPSIVLSNATCSGAVAMHEYGHTVNLQDRTTDSDMIMYKYGYAGDEVTVFDGQAFYSGPPAVWFDAPSF